MIQFHYLTRVEEEREANEAKIVCYLVFRKAIM